MRPRSLDDGDRASVLAPDRFKGGQARLARGGRKERQVPAIEPGGIPRGGDKRARNDADSEQRFGAKSAGPRAKPPCEQANVSRPPAEWRAGESRSKPCDALAGYREPGPPWPFHRAHRRVEEPDQADFIARIGQVPRDLERDKPARRITAQIVRTVRLSPLDFAQVVGGHRLDARVRHFVAYDAPGAYADHCARVSDSPRRCQHFDDVAADAVDEEYRRLAVSSLESHERRRAGCAPLAQCLAQEVKPRRLVDQRH